VVTGDRVSAFARLIETEILELTIKKTQPLGQKFENSPRNHRKICSIRDLHPSGDSSSSMVSLFPVPSRPPQIYAQNMQSDVNDPAQSCRTRYPINKPCTNPLSEEGPRSTGPWQPPFPFSLAGLTLGAPRLGSDQLLADGTDLEFDGLLRSCSSHGYSQPTRLSRG
jgi:hypothetical protein